MTLLWGFFDLWWGTRSSIWRGVQTAPRWGGGHGAAIGLCIIMQSFKFPTSRSQTDMAGLCVKLSELNPILRRSTLPPHRYENNQNLWVFIEKKGIFYAWLYGVLSGLKESSVFLSLKMTRGIPSLLTEIDTLVWVTNGYDLLGKYGYWQNYSLQQDISLETDAFPHDKFPDRTNLSYNTVTGNCLPDHVI